MRFFRDNDTLVTVRWFRVPVGTPFLPFYTRFASGNWSSDRMPWDGPGEVEFAPRPWSNGKTPATADAGAHICGTPEEWAEGLTWDPDAPPVLYDRWGMPLCCFPPAPAPAFGFAGRVLGGVAAAIAAGSDWVTAGRELDGAAASKCYAVDRSSAGRVLGGAAQIAGRVPVAGVAGRELDGAAASKCQAIAGGVAGRELGASAAFAPIAAGSVVAGRVLNGAAAIKAHAVITGVAGRVLGGAAAIARKAIVAGVAGRELDGAAAIAGRVPVAGVAGRVLNGAAALKTSGKVAGVAGRVLGGAAVFEGESVLAGTVIMGGWVTTPAGYLLCDGASYLRTDYPALFNAIQGQFGSADSTHFNVPDLRQRVPMGVGAIGGRGPTAVLGGTGGEPSHVLSVTEMPSHKHTFGGASNFSTWVAENNAPTNLQLLSTGNFGNVRVMDTTGGGAAHENRQPFQAINFYIAY